jgi:hypothetical protein
LLDAENLDNLPFIIHWLKRSIQNMGDHKSSRVGNIGDIDSKGPKPFNTCIVLRM